MIFLTCLLMCCLSLSVIMATAETSKEYKDSTGNKFVAEIDENGWHKNNPGTAYMDEAGNVIIGTQFGSYNSAGSHLVTGNTSTFVLAYGNNLNINQLDLTKKTKIKFRLDPNWSNHSWFIFSVIDGLENAYKAASNTWNLGTEGVKINMWGSNYVETDANYKDYGHLANKICVNGALSENSMNYDKTGYGELEFYIGETAEESYVNFGGIKVIAPNVKRSDFREGAYLHVAINEVLEIEVQITQESAWYHTVKIKSKTGKYEYVSVEVKDGDTLYGTLTYFDEYGFAFTYVDENGNDFGVDDAVTKDMELTLKWYEEEIVLYHKLHGVVDEEYPYEIDTDDNGWDANYTQWDIGDSFVDKDGNEIINSYYGSYQHDTSFYTYEDETGFLICSSGSITNLLKLDVSKEITIKWSARNWDYQNNAVTGKIRFALYDGLLKSLKGGGSDLSVAKVLLQTETVKEAENFGKMQDMLSGKLSALFADATLEQPFENDRFYITIYISEDGTENYVKINGEKFSDLEGVKRRDFIGGYAYLSVSTSGSTQYIRSLVSQKSDITVVQPEHGTVSADKTEGVGFRDKITVTVSAEKGYKAKSVFVGDVEYELDGADSVVVYKGWGDETVTAVVGKEYTVTFVTGGGSAVNPQTVCDGDIVFKPANPKKEGFTFEGWYADEACTELYNFRTPVTKDITLYAKWKEDKKEEPEKTGGCSSAVGGGSAACFAVTIAAIGFVVLRKKNK